MDDFSPSFVGQLSFCCAVLDDKVKHAQDGSTIGLLLCKSRNRVVVEYALRDAATPLGIADTTPLGIADTTHSGELLAPEVLQQLLALDHEKTIEA